jgi:predicted nucleotidyltransferase
MEQLSVQQRELIGSLTAQLASIQGIRAIVLGGSHARGWAQPGSDIDLGLLYSDAAPLAIAELRS